MAEEQSYYSGDKGIRVTDKRLIIDTTTYAMANITSVKRTVTYPSRNGPLLFMGIGILLTYIGLTQRDSGAAMMWGIVLLLLGFFWWKGQRPTFNLRIASASGESDALKSEDQEHIDQIVRAVNEAFIHRGSSTNS